jgi:hypothetical protein
VFFIGTAISAILPNGQAYRPVGKYTYEAIKSDYDERWGFTVESGNT